MVSFSYIEVHGSSLGLFTMEPHVVTMCVCSGLITLCMYMYMYMYMCNVVLNPSRLIQHA